MSTQVVLALTSLAEAWLRDTVYGGVGLLSFVAGVCGFAALARRVRPARQWLALLLGALAAGGALALVLTG